MAGLDMSGALLSQHPRLQWHFNHSLPSNAGKAMVLTGVGMTLEGTFRNLWGRGPWVIRMHLALEAIEAWHPEQHRQFCSVKTCPAWPPGVSQMFLLMETYLQRLKPSPPTPFHIYIKYIYCWHKFIHTKFFKNAITVKIERRMAFGYHRDLDQESLMLQWHLDGHWDSPVPTPCQLSCSL